MRDSYHPRTEGELAINIHVLLTRYGGFRKKGGSKGLLLKKIYETAGHVAGSDSLHGAPELDVCETKTRLYHTEFPLSYKELVNDKHTNCQMVKAICHLDI